MALNAIGRKALLDHGKQREIADRIRVNPATVSNAVNGVGFPLSRKGWVKYRKAQVAIARALGMKLEEAFQPHELNSGQTIVSKFGDRTELYDLKAS
jgi:hypothetical protein